MRFVISVLDLIGAKGNFQWYDLSHIIFAMRALKFYTWKMSLNSKKIVKNLHPMRKSFAPEICYFSVRSYGGLNVTLNCHKLTVKDCINCQIP